MSFINVLNNINDIEDAVVSFTTADNMTEFPYPSIILFKGRSEQYGKGYAILVDYENVLEFWGEDWIEDEKTMDLAWEIMEITKVYYRPKSIEVPVVWEEFQNFMELFIQNNEIEILREEFENSQTQNIKTINSLDNSMKIMDIIRDTLADFFISDEILYNLEIKGSGKLLIFSIDVNKYINMANMLNSEMEKKLLWIIIRVILEKSVLKEMKKFNPRVVSNGIIKVPLTEENMEYMHDSFLKLKKDLSIDPDIIYELYNNLINKTNVIGEIEELSKLIEKESDIKFLEIFDLLVVNYINNGDESILEKLKNISNKFDFKIN